MNSVFVIRRGYDLLTKEGLFQGAQSDAAAIRAFESREDAESFLKKLGGKPSVVEEIPCFERLFLHFCYHYEIAPEEQNEIALHYHERYLDGDMESQPWFLAPKALKEDAVLAPRGFYYSNLMSKFVFAEKGSEELFGEILQAESVSATTYGDSAAIRIRSKIGCDIEVTFSERTTNVRITNSEIGCMDKTVSLLKSSDKLEGIFRVFIGRGDRNCDPPKTLVLGSKGVRSALAQVSAIDEEIGQLLEKRKEMIKEFGFAV